MRRKGANVTVLAAQRCIKHRQKLNTVKNLKDRLRVARIPIERERERERESNVKKLVGE